MPPNAASAGLSALIPATPYGRAVEPAFPGGAARNNAELLGSETYTPDAGGILSSAKRILETIESAEAAGKPVDALFLPSGPDEIAKLGPLLAYSGFEWQQGQAYRHVGLGRARDRTR